jgi:hypothetical protein
MKFPGSTFAFVALFATLADAPAYAFGREEFKVSMQDVVKEMNQMRRELRDLKVQRDRDQREIAELRQIVEHRLPDLDPVAPQPAVARPAAETPQPAETAEPVRPPSPGVAAGSGPAAAAKAPRTRSWRGFLHLKGVKWESMQRQWQRPTPVSGGAASPRSRLVFQNERHHQANPVFGDLPLLDHGLLVLHPRALHSVQSLASAIHPQLHGVFEALGGAGDNFRYTGD